MDTKRLILRGTLIMFVITGIWLQRTGLRTHSWEERLAEPQLSENEFTALYAEAVKDRLEGASVEIAGPLELLVKVPQNESEFKCYLGNVWSECRDSPEQRVTTCNWYLDIFFNNVASMDDSQLEVEPNALIPAMKSIDYLEQLPLQDDGSRPVVAEHFAADIWIVYAFDLGNTIQFLTDDDVASLEFDKSEMKDMAVKNLVRMLPEVKRHGEGSIYLIGAGGTHEASLLLLSELWEDQEQFVKGKVVAAIPSRDFLFFTGSESAEGVERLRAAVNETYEAASHLISRSLLVFRDGQWEVFEEDLQDANGKGSQ